MVSSGDEKLRAAFEAWKKKHATGSSKKLWYYDTYVKTPDFEKWRAVHSHLRKVDELRKDVVSRKLKRSSDAKALKGPELFKLLVDDDETKQQERRGRNAAAELDGAEEGQHAGRPRNNARANSHSSAFVSNSASTSSSDDGDDYDDDDDDDDDYGDDGDVKDERDKGNRDFVKARRGRGVDGNQGDKEKKSRQGSRRDEPPRKVGLLRKVVSRARLSASGTKTAQKSKKQKGRGQRDDSDDEDSDDDSDESDANTGAEDAGRDVHGDHGDHGDHSDHSGDEDEDDSDSADDEDEHDEAGGRRNANKARGETSDEDDDGDTDSDVEMLDASDATVPQDLGPYLSNDAEAARNIRSKMFKFYVAKHIQRFGASTEMHAVGFCDKHDVSKGTGRGKGREDLPAHPGWSFYVFYSAAEVGQMGLTIPTEEDRAMKYAAYDLSQTPATRDRFVCISKIVVPHWNFDMISMHGVNPLVIELRQKYHQKKPSLKGTAVWPQDVRVQVELTDRTQRWMSVTSARTFIGAKNFSALWWKWFLTAWAKQFPDVKYQADVRWERLADTLNMLTQKDEEGKQVFRSWSAKKRGRAEVCELGDIYGTLPNRTQRFSTGAVSNRTSPERQLEAMQNTSGLSTPPSSRRSTPAPKSKRDKS